jgi:hypothetical protein
LAYNENVKADIRRYEGAICILDALGAKQQTVEDAEAFIRLRDWLMVQTSADSYAYAEDLLEVADGQPEDPKSLSFKINRVSGNIKTEYFTFGDSIIAFWERPQTLEAIYALSAAAKWIKAFLFASIRRGLLFRGSLAYGEFVSNGRDTVLGPAIADAAQWFEQPQMVGVVCTPGTGRLICRHIEMARDFPNPLSGEPFLEYSVPTKNSKIRLWTVTWPRVFYETEDTAGVPHILLYCSERECIERLMGEHIPYGTEAKHINTVDYFLECIDQLDLSEEERLR